MGAQPGKINEALSFDKPALLCFNEQSLGEREGLLRLDIWKAEFMDHKDILEKPQDREEAKKDSVYAWERPYRREETMGTPQIFRESLSLSREFLSSCRGSTNRRAGDTQTAFLRGCSCETTDGNHLNFQLNLSPPADGRFLPTWLWQAPCKQTLAHPGLQT